MEPHVPADYLIELAEQAPVSGLPSICGAHPTVRRHCGRPDFWARRFKAANYGIPPGPLPTSFAGWYRLYAAMPMLYAILEFLVEFAPNGPGRPWPTFRVLPLPPDIDRSLFSPQVADYLRELAVAAKQANAPDVMLRLYGVHRYGPSGTSLVGVEFLPDSPEGRIGQSTRVEMPVAADMILRLIAAGVPVLSERDNANLTPEILLAEVNNERRYRRGE